jgi:hypothetical protein
MDTVVLDSNIYDRLELDVETRELLSKFVTQGMLQVISTPRIRRELEESPLQGIPDWFPVVQELESVSILPFRLGETRLGKGEVFRAHLGESAKRADAEITDSANAYADVFVTDDRRCRKRAQECAPLCKTLTYPDFKAWLCKFRAK